MLPKANNQGKVGTLPEIEDTQKPIPPIETQIIEKVPEQNTDDKTQIIQTMVPKPKKPIEKIPTPIVMPEPAIVMDPDKTGTTTSEPSLGEDPSTTNIEFDDDDEGDMENLDKIKKDIANIMTKLDQAEVE